MLTLKLRTQLSEDCEISSIERCKLDCRQIVEDCVVSDRVCEVGADREVVRWRRVGIASRHAVREPAVHRFFHRAQHVTRASSART